MMTYHEWKKLVAGRNPGYWRTKPISPTCEHRTANSICGKPTFKAYPVHGGGWMALCYDCGLKHDEAWLVYALIAEGETMTPDPTTPQPIASDEERSELQALSDSYTKSFPKIKNLTLFVLNRLAKAEAELAEARQEIARLKGDYGNDPTDEEVDRFMREFAEGKHALSPEDAAAIAKSKDWFPNLLRETVARIKAEQELAAAKRVISRNRQDASSGPRSANRRHQAVTNAGCERGTTAIGAWR